MLAMSLVFVDYMFKNVF